MLLFINTIYLFNNYLTLNYSELQIMIINIVSYFCLILGLIFWLWGTPVLLQKRSLLYKLHNLSVADTLGSILIVIGVSLKIPRELPLLILAIISLAIWNTMLGYVLAYSTNSQEEKTHE